MGLELKNIELSLREKREFYSSFASLYESGVPINDIFKTMGNSTKSTKIKLISGLISKKIDRGKTLNEAIKPCIDILGIAYSKLLTAGEESGKLEEILSRICSNIAKQQDIQSNLMTALVYPVFMLIFASTIALFFQFFVLPMLRSSYDYSMDVNMRSLAIFAVIKIVLIYIIAAGIVLYIAKNPNIKNMFKNFISSLWIIKGILRNYYFTNFFYTMSLAYDAGIPALNSIELANSVIGIEEVRKKIQGACKMIENGTSVSKALNVTGVFSGFAMSQIASGEESGRLEKTLVTAAQDYESQMDLSIKTLQKLLAPIFIIIIGVIIGFVIIQGYSEYYKSILSIIG